MGLIDKPVYIELKDGSVNSVSGGRIAEILQHWFERLGPECRLAA